MIDNPITPPQFPNIGYNLDPGSESSTAQGANIATQSSGQPYQPIVGPQGTQDQLGQYQTNAVNPSVPNQEQITSQPIENTPDTTLNQQYSLGPGNPNAPGANTATAAIAEPIAPTTASSYNAAQATAAQGRVDPNSLVENQLQRITSTNLNANGVPNWAQPAVTAANQRMNSLGLGASTMAGGATASAVLQAAIPLAQQNANTYATLNLTNLANQQQTLLSNQAATNASLQFNAQSQQQNTQFFSSLDAQIAQQNADRLTAVRQFNAGQQNSVNEFNSNLDSQREEFNTQNQLLIDQSNVQWRRAINTANTAEANAANQTNAQNLFNLSTTAQNNVWQQARDEASWNLTSEENSQNRLLSLVNSSLNRQTSFSILASQLNANLFSNLGSLGVNLLNGGLGSSVGKALFGDSSSSDTGGGSPGSSYNSSPGSSGGDAGGSFSPGGSFGGGNYGSYATGGPVGTKSFDNGNYSNGITPTNTQGIL